MARIARPTAALALMFALPSISQAASFQFTTLAVPGQRITSVSFSPNAINDVDQVVGSVEDNAFNFQGLLWSSSGYKLYPQTSNLAVINNAGLAAGYTPGLERGYITINTATAKAHAYSNGFDKNPFLAHIYGINASGTIVAQDQYRPNVSAGYLFQAKKKTQLLKAGSNLKYGGTFATAINDLGLTVGSYFAGGTAQHGFTYQNGSFTSFDAPNALGGTFPDVVGNDGRIAGGYATAPGASQTGFVRSNGQYQTIAPPGATISYVAAFGPGGELAGSFWDGTGGHGFTYLNGAYTTIDVPGGTYTTIGAVNARGTLVGTYHDANGNVLSYVATCAIQTGCTN